MRTAAILIVASSFLFPWVSQAAEININTADAAVLDTLPGIGPSKAAAIVDYRTAHGPFARVEDIQKVKGIGPTTFANMKNLITVDAANASMPTQPQAKPVSYQKVQEVEPITSTKPDNTVHDDAAVAPTAANELAAVGAASATQEPFTAPSRAAGLFSVWTLGFLGVVALAGGAFIFI